MADWEIWVGSRLGTIGTSRLQVGRFWLVVGWEPLVLVGYRLGDFG